MRSDMSLDTVPTLLSIAGALAAGISGLGGLIKFSAWWKDRLLSTRIESACALLDKGSCAWQKSLGERLFIRCHFARLTGIDVPDGHTSLLTLHERLGGTDAHLGLIRRAVHRLDRQALCAQPRTMLRQDWWAAIGATFFCLVFALLAFVLVGLLATAMDRLDWNQPIPVSKFMLFVVGGMYAASAALFAWLLFKEADRYIAAHHILQLLRSRAK